MPAPNNARLLRVHPAAAADLRHRSAHLRAARRHRRTAPALATMPSPTARRRTLLCLRHTARLVPDRRRRPSPAAVAVDLHGPRAAGEHILVSLRDSGTVGLGRAAPNTGRAVPAMSGLAPTLEARFTERLVGQRHASPNTIAAYRDSWRLLPKFTHSAPGRSPAGSTSETSTPTSSARS